MNHLLRTLTESKVRPTVDLRILLTTVKDGRRLKDDAKDAKDSRLSDPFYDSLEGLLSDLKAVTVDNRDAEAFLKPVSKAEVPDYYDVIANPMDFQTMLRKVKQKTYKSKREFKDDLELIWSNCYTYNASENHPLRQCVKRLQAKAEKLLKYITDRKDRLDPSIPSGLPSPTGSDSAHNLRDLNSEQRPRKRSRYATQCPTPLLDEKDDFSHLWSSPVPSDSLSSNGLPGIPFGPSSSSSKLHPKLKRPKSSKHPPPPPPNPKSLLSMMNHNIKTMRRVRHTHAKFNALTASSALPEDEEQGAEGGTGGGVYGSGGIDGIAPRTGMPSVIGAGFVGSGFGPGEDDSLADRLDEEPWAIGRGKKRGRKNISGVEIGEANATDCLHWAGNKILEHVGFQATSKVALDVLAAVTSEYLLNVGRTIRFLSDKFGKTMTPEEIILHTLFESGSSKIQDLERYISDDIERYGLRLAELEKKIVGAYRETGASELLEDEGLFEEEDEDETGALAIGEFADVLGEDYLGLRALGIAAEFGLSNLSIPKKLLKGKKGQSKPTAAKPSEAPLPYPPPPPFVPLTAADIEDQIGLLKPYYHNRIALLVASSVPPIAAPPAPLPGPVLGPSPPSLNPSLPQPPPTLPPGNHSSNPPPPPPPPPDLVLPDDAPNHSQIKMSPVGQIVKSSGAGGGAKKKGKATVEGVAGAGVNGAAALRPSTLPVAVGMSGMRLSESGVQKKKKAATGVGTGNGRKKNAPPVVLPGLVGQGMV